MEDTAGRDEEGVSNVRIDEESEDIHKEGGNPMSVCGDTRNRVFFYGGIPYQALIANPSRHVPKLENIHKYSLAS